MLDCKGLACPQPVLKAKELVEASAPAEVLVLVDNKAASENVSRFLGTQGYRATVEARGADFLVKAEKDGSLPKDETASAEEYSCEVPASGKTCLFVQNDKIGHGDDVLGAGLMKNFLATLKEMGPELWRIVFVNNGVKLCCEGSESLETIQELEKSGVSVLVCGTCLTHFDMLDDKRVGETTNMLDVVTSLQVAAKVISV